MPSESQTTKKAFSVKYQPRRMVLSKKKQIHVLGMSLTRLNVSMSYKNRIKSLLINNKSLAQLLAQTQHENTLKDQEILQLKKKENCRNVPAVVKHKLHAICDHMEIMVDLIKDAMSSCDFPQDSSTNSSNHNRKRPAETPAKPTVRREKHPGVACTREEQWTSNMTVIEEQSFMDNEALPPLLYADEEPISSSGKYVTSRSTSRSDSTRMKKSKSSRCSSLFGENISQEETKTSRGSKDSPFSSLGTTPKSPLLLSQNMQFEEKKDSFDSEIAMQYDPILLSQAVVSHNDNFESKHEEVHTEKFEDNCLTETENVSSSEKVEDKPSQPSKEVNKTRLEEEDMDLTETVLSSQLPAPNVPLSPLNGNRKNKLSRLNKKILELSQSFCEPSLFDEENDPDYVCQPKKRCLKSPKKQVPKREKKVESALNVSHAFFATSPKPKKKRTTKKATLKAKKNAKQKGEVVESKRDVKEHPSAVFDLSVGDSLSQSTIQPYKPFSKRLSAEKAPPNDVQKELKKQPKKRKENKCASVTNCGSDCKTTMGLQEMAVNMPSMKEKDGLQVVQEGLESPKSSALASSSQKIPANSRSSLNRRRTQNAELAPGPRRSSRISLAEKDATPDSSRTSTDSQVTRGCRRTSANVISYRLPPLNSKLRRET